MQQQTFQERRAVQMYQDVPRSARSEFRSGRNEAAPFKCSPVVTFPAAPGVPGSAPQTFSRLDTRRFWVGLAVVIGVVAGLRIAGVL